MENATIKGCSPVLTALLNNMLTKQDNVIFFITPEMCQWIGLGKWAQTRSTTYQSFVRGKNTTVLMA